MGRLLSTLCIHPAAGPLSLFVAQLAQLGYERLYLTDAESGFLCNYVVQLLNIFVAVDAEMRSLHRGGGSHFELGLDGLNHPFHIFLCCLVQIGHDHIIPSVCHCSSYFTMITILMLWQRLFWQAIVAGRDGCCLRVLD